jgi:hypothetical protein
MSNSTLGMSISDRTRIGGKAKPNNPSMLQLVALQVEFGDCFAYMYCDVEQRKSK